MFGNFRTKKFSDIYSNVNDFLDDYTNIGIPNIITTTNATTLYYLLYATTVPFFINGVILFGFVSIIAIIEIFTIIRTMYCKL